MKPLVIAANFIEAGIFQFRMDSDKASFIVYVCQLKEVEHMEDLAIQFGAVAKRIEENWVEYFVPGILHVDGTHEEAYNQTINFRLFKTFELFGEARRSNSETAFLNAQLKDDLQTAIGSLKKSTCRDLTEYLDKWRLKNLGDAYTFDDLLEEAIDQAKADFAPLPYLTEMELRRKSLGLAY